MKCRKNTESKNPKAVKTKSGKIMILPKFAVYNSKKSKVNRDQEASRLLSSLGINIPLSKIPFGSSLLF